MYHNLDLLIDLTEFRSSRFIEHTTFIVVFDQQVTETQYYYHYHPVSAATAPAACFLVTAAYGAGCKLCIRIFKPCLRSC